VSKITRELKALIETIDDIPKDKLQITAGIIKSVADTTTARSTPAGPAAAMAMATTTGGAGAGATPRVILEVDGEKLANVLLPYIEDRIRPELGEA
jgi:hypothetical protein